MEHPGRKILLGEATITHRSEVHHRYYKHQKYRCLHCIQANTAFTCSLDLLYLLNLQVKKNCLGVSAAVGLLQVAKSEFCPGLVLKVAFSKCTASLHMHAWQTPLWQLQEWVEDEQAILGKGIFPALPSVTCSCSYTPVSGRMLVFSVHLSPGHCDDIWPLLACADRHQVLWKPPFQAWKTFVWRHKHNPENPRHWSSTWFTTYLFLSLFPPYVCEEG